MSLIEGTIGSKGTASGPCAVSSSGRCGFSPGTVFAALLRRYMSDKLQSVPGFMPGCAGACKIIWQVNKGKGQHVRQDVQAAKLGSGCGRPMLVHDGQGAAQGGVQHAPIVCLHACTAWTCRCVLSLWAAHASMSGGPACACWTEDSWLRLEGPGGARMSALLMYQSML